MVSTRSQPANGVLLRSFSPHGVRCSMEGYGKNLNADRNSRGLKGEAEVIIKGQKETYKAAKLTVMH